jgi:hypothetical protein
MNCYVTLSKKWPCIILKQATGEDDLKKTRNQVYGADLFGFGVK